MCMGPRVKDQEQMRPYFREAKILADRFKDRMGMEPILSMGMSQDFEVAIQEGATMVRIGTAIFKDSRRIQ